MSREQKLMKDVEAEASALCQKILKTMGPQQQIVAMNALYLAMQVVDSAGPSNDQVERPVQQPDGAMLNETLEGWHPIDTAPRDGTVVEVPSGCGYTSAFFQDGFWWWHDPSTDGLAVGPVPKGWRQMPSND